ncbi:hypothetical protein Cni_G18588 [Canna indica]|uniref:RNase H type-1 domain-containing protein n=1 Tax=Canna indica TaxID=4628 RepID=A0AAQ3KJU9_9LILI|nr:hypothetical protein Cni_G18588 [Canna indica]
MHSCNRWFPLSFLIEYIICSSLGCSLVTPSSENLHNNVAADKSNTGSKAIPSTVPQHNSVHKGTSIENLYGPWMIVNRRKKFAGKRNALPEIKTSNGFDTIVDQCDEKMVVESSNLKWQEENAWKNIVGVYNNQDNKCAGLGVLALKSDGCLIFEESCSRIASSPLHAELWAIKLAVEKTSNLNLRNFTLFSDCSTAIKFLNGNCKAP